MNNRLPELDPIRHQAVKYVEDVAIKMAASAFVMNIFTENYKEGIDSLLQFSVAVMLDKPIYLLVPEGTKVPENVKRIAQGIEFYKNGDKASLAAAGMRLLEEARTKTFSA